MTSVASKNLVKRKTEQKDDGRESDGSEASREGIFDKFAGEATAPLLYYYTVQSSSDSEGNITLHDVKREAFGPDVRVMTSEESDSSDNPEGERRSSRYRLRTRRLWKHRGDDFDMYVCDDSSDDMSTHDKAVMEELSSDDETYDVTTDNWTYVRCGKKKATSDKEKAAKKNLSPKKAANKPKPSKLRIKLRSALMGKRKVKKEPTKTMTSPKKSIGSLTSSSATSSRNSSPAKTAKMSGSAKEEKSSHAKKVIVTSHRKSAMTQSNDSMMAMQASKKRILRRCGYNPTAPKLAEIRHIRRRQLKQNPKRVKHKTEAEAPVDNLTASSSDDERSEEEGGLKSGPTRTHNARRHSKGIAESARANNVRKTEHHVPPNATNPDDKTPPNKAAAFAGTTAPSNGLTVAASNGTDETPTGRGIKLVIRRQSLENGDVIKGSGIKGSNSEQEHTGKMDFCPKILQSKKMHILKTVRVKASTTPEKQKRVDEAEAASATPTPVEKDTQDQKDSNGDKEATADKGNPPIIASENLTEDIPGDSDITNKQTTNEETVKKKKTKKKKKKDRGRPSASAANEDPANAEETAMRLAMELPRHNWLVNKLKAEDAKPPTPSPEEQKFQEGSNIEELTRVAKEQLAPLVQQNEAKDSSQPTSDIKELNKDTFTSAKDTKSSSETEVFKAANTVKSSSMVGIVKPFQHLKMFPATIASNGSGEGDGQESYDPMSPPALCIVDEDAPTLQEEGMKSDKLPSRDSSFNSNDNQETQNGVHSDTPATNGSHDVQLTDLHHPTTVEDPTTSSVVETASDIKISNCFSLALDLSNKSPQKVTDVNQPLDLSVGPKQGGLSPEVLDLSVKKPQDITKKTPTGTPTSTPNHSTGYGITNGPLPPTTGRQATDIIVIEDVDDGSVTETTSMSFLNDPTGNRDREKERIKECFVRLTDARVPGTSHTPETELKAPSTSPSLDPKKFVSPEKCLKRHVSAPALPNDEAEPSPAKRHQSVDGLRPLPSPDVIVQLNHKPLQQNLTLSSQGDLKSSPQLAALKRMCKLDDAASPKKRRFSEDAMQRIRLAPPTTMPPAYSQDIKPTINSLVYQARTGPQLTPQSLNGPATPTRTGHLIGPPSISKLSPQPIAEKFQLPTLHAPGKEISLQLSLPSVTTRVMTPQSPGILRTTGQSAGHFNKLTPTPPTPIRPKIYPTTCRPQSQPSQYPLYYKHPQDVNNNNAVTTVQKVIAPRQRVIYNPSGEVYIQGGERPPQGVMRQVVRAPPGGVHIERYQMNQHLNRTPSTQAINPTRGPIPIRHPEPQAQGHPKYQAPDVQDILQQQQRAVEEKISQLEALKQQLKVQQHNVQLQSKQQIAQQQHQIAQQQHIAQHQQQIAQHQVMTNRFHAPNQRPQATPMTRLSTNPPPRLPVRQVMPQQSQAIRQQLQVINSQAAAIARAPPTYQQRPYYRNGGLTINRKEPPSEPIVIEDDSPTSQSLIARNRHSYSFHPPLSKNKTLEQAQRAAAIAQQQSQSQVRQPNVGQFQNRNTASRGPDSSIEQCIVCQKKAFFLCSGCKKMWYCSKDCQFKDWPSHSKKCSG